jgi:hypothetical protein
MEKRQMLDLLRLNSERVAPAAESTLQRDNAALQRQNAVLLDDNEDLRASALWWKALYEEALRRCADLEHSSPKARVTSRMDVRFPVSSSSSAHALRPGATTRPR